VSHVWIVCDVYENDLAQVRLGEYADIRLNAYPDRLDLCDVHLRLARQHGVKILINTDAHHTSHFEKLKYGVLQARRAWLTASDVLNTLPVDELLAAIKRG